MQSNASQVARRHDAGRVAITTSGGAAGVAVTWRMRGALFVTAIVKGTFHLVPDAVMTPFGPEPIAQDEQDDGSGMGLYSASDLAPYLRYTDVELTGHAHPLPGAREIEACLEVIRDGRRLLHKSVRLRVPEGAGVTPPVRVVGMAPLSKSWPVRRRLLGDLDPRALDAPILEIPDRFDWLYFQTAPLDQRIGSLQGNEWIAFTGMTPRRAWFRTRLPGVRAGAKLYGPTQRQGVPIRLAADTLHIDVDRQICTVLWRGWFPVGEERDLATIHLTLGLEPPGQATAPPAAGAEAGSHGLPPCIGEVAPARPIRVVPPQLSRPPFEATGPGAYAKTLIGDAAQRSGRQAAIAGGPRDPALPRTVLLQTAEAPRVCSKTLNMADRHR
jgi:hypothetical protein